MYRRWHVIAILWRAVWEIDELARDGSSEVTLKRGNKSQTVNWCGINVAGRHLANKQEYSVFQVFGAPNRKINVVVVSRPDAHTHTQTRREGCSIEHVFGRWRKRLERRPPGASVQSCLLGSWRGWTGPRCRPRDMRCDIEGRFHLRYTRLDPSYHGKTSGMDQMSPNRTRPRSIIFLSFPLGGLSLSPTTAVDIQPPPDLGFAARSSVPAIL